MSRLQPLLADIIIREFPKIRSEIESCLQEVCDLLHELGPKRGSPEEQRRFLDWCCGRLPDY